MKPIVVNLIPTYNERDHVEKLVTELHKIALDNRKYKFITLIADDNSPDGTGQIVKDLQEKYSDLYLISHKKEGLGRAMTRGYEYAIKKLKADIVITNEADFSYSLNKIPFMLKKIDEGFDIVIATRHSKGGGTKGWTLSRKLNHFIANYFFATIIASNHTVTDHNGAFRAVRVKGILDKINFKMMKPTGFGFFNYSLFLFTQISDKYYEFPVQYKFRTLGESKVSFNPKYIKTYARDVFEYIDICLRIRCRRI